MRKAVHPSGSMGSLNPRRWRGERLQHHGDVVCHVVCALCAVFDSYILDVSQSEPPRLAPYQNGKFQNGISRYFQTKYHTKHLINVPQNGKFQNGISRYSKTKYHTWTLILMFFLLFFCCRDYDWSDDESDSDFNNMHQHDEYSHSEIINQCNFGSKHLINARLSSQTCLQHQADSSTQNAITVFKFE